MAEYFHEPLDDINFQDSSNPIDVNTASNAFLAAITESGNDPNDFDIFISTKSAKEPFPHNFDQFINQWRYFPDQAAPGVQTGVDPGDSQTAIINALTDQFKTTLQTNSDWATLALSDEQIGTFAVGAFGNFLRAFPYEEFPNGVTTAGFTDEWNKFMTVTAVLLDSSKAGDYADMPSFEEIYMAFFPPGDNPALAQAAFHDRLEEFVFRFLDGKAYFLPSHHVEDWVYDLQSQWEKSLAVKLSPDERVRRNIMVLVFKILRTILERLQETAAIQAEYLRFLTDYQGEYTELMGRVPIYQANPGRLVGSAALWEDVPGILDNQGDHFSDQAEDQVRSGIGSNNRGDLWEVKGFAGITLKEIRELGLVMPTVFGYADWQVRLAEAQTPGTSGFNSALVGVTSGSQPIPPDSPFYYMGGEEVPGVWWLVEQPYDGSGKYGGSPKADSEMRQDLNQVRQQWIEQLRSRRNIVKDEAKEAQSAMSNTRESINQQSNLMTSIISQLSSILQAIFR